MIATARYRATSSNENSESVNRRAAGSQARRHSRLRPSKAMTVLLTLGLALVPTLAACGRSGGSNGNKAPSSTASSSGTSSTAAAGAGLGDFGTLKAVCGPGNASGGIGRGVTATTIKIGVNADPGSSAAPGLEQEFFDTADGFAKWCNAAGGINGRKIIVDKHDAKLFNVGQAVTEACQSDFMSVGGGNAFDSAGVKIRENCKLAQIPAYVVSPQAVNATLQVQSAPVPTNITINGVLRLLANAYPETKTKGIGIAGSNLASLIPTGLKTVEYLKDIGIKAPVFQQQPPSVDNYRPYMEQMKTSGVSGMYVFNGVSIVPIFQAINNIGWKPSWVSLSVQFYGKAAKQGAASLGSTLPPTYIQFTTLPFELADKYPVLKQTQQIVTAAAPNTNLDNFTESAMSAWLLWAVSAKSCGSDLTSACVLAKAPSYTDWTAGGLYPPQNIKTGVASPCVTVVRLTAQGYSYDQKVTAPTTGDAPFNCDPENLKQVKTYETS
jgi:ABC-type branched-subunit amino acid transport system substrate-binding protein